MFWLGTTAPFGSKHEFLVEACVKGFENMDFVQTFLLHWARAGFVNDRIVRCAVGGC